jgi:flagellar hook-basal body complex protein FliE
MVNITPNIGSVANIPKGPGQIAGAPKIGSADSTKTDFSSVVKNVGKQVSKVSDLQQASNASVMDLLAGKNTDINSIVSAVAKADMSFKLLVGVRNKLVEAYKQTMNMPI